MQIKINKSTEFNKNHLAFSPTRKFHKTDKRKNLMGVGKFNKKSNQEELLNPLITIGKGKGESYSPALSLQDVFSDSGSNAGGSQKTSCRSDTGQGKETQLDGKVNSKPGRKPFGGKRKLQNEDRWTIKLQAHVTAVEYQMLSEQFRTSGLRYLSDYLRILILDRGKAKSITNKQELVKQLDSIGIQISRIGNNINQIAKYANIQLKSGKMDQRTMERFNNLMEDYLKEERNLIRAYQVLVRNKE